MPGYSGRPLIQKLGIKPGMRVRFIDAPAHYERILGPLPDEVVVLKSTRGPLDFVHAFCDRRARLVSIIPTCLVHLAPDGMIWISWPKRASGVPTDVTEDVVRDVALPTGLVDVKVCAVDDVWSGLKLVIRKELRKKSSTP